MYNSSALYNLFFPFSFYFILNFVIYYNKAICLEWTIEGTAYDRHMESYYPFVMQYAPVLAISFFIILPLISREATIRRISTEHQILSYRHISSTLRKEIRREKILAGVLWVCLVFCPFIFFCEDRRVTIIRCLI